MTSHKESHHGTLYVIDNKYKWDQVASSHDAVIYIELAGYDERRLVQGERETDVKLYKVVSHNVYHLSSGYSAGLEEARRTVKLLA